MSRLVEVEEVKDVEKAYWRKRPTASNYILEDVENGELEQYSAVSVESQAHKVYQATLWAEIGIGKVEELEEPEESLSEDVKEVILLTGVPSLQAPKSDNCLKYQSESPPPAFQKPIRIPKT
ncbi:hypothetical protein ARMGADRAFT_1088522 [Armillaria gallica]|uniref:Uncharacterized protein n=1 Tax=Armillaria gallica TaxID=47427 RepID=A0A2H3CMN8_ARMGA|nr:hypothetical protein ARMGADRAFT_1088522 [Armillaria gallica]